MNYCSESLWYECHIYVNLKILGGNMFSKFKVRDVCRIQKKKKKKNLVKALEFKKIYIIYEASIDHFRRSIHFFYIKS